MKAKLLKKLRKKYSSDYKICKTYDRWEVYEKLWYIDIDTYRTISTLHKTKEKAIAYVRNCVNSKIERYIRDNKRTNVTSKMLYG